MTKLIMFVILAAAAATATKHSEARGCLNYDDYYRSFTAGQACQWSADQTQRVYDQLAEERRAEREEQMRAAKELRGEPQVLKVYHIKGEPPVRALPVPGKEARPSAPQGEPAPEQQQQERENNGQGSALDGDAGLG